MSWVSVVLEKWCVHTTVIREEASVKLELRLCNDHLQKPLCCRQGVAVSSRDLCVGEHSVCYQ